MIIGMKVVVIVIYHVILLVESLYYLITIIISKGYVNITHTCFVERRLHCVFDYSIHHTGSAGPLPGAVTYWAEDGQINNTTNSVPLNFIGPCVYLPRAVKLPRRRECCRRLPISTKAV